MKRINLLATFVISFNVLAIKSSNLTQNTLIEASSCLIKLSYPDNEKKGICSAALISKTQLLTAKHCFLENPTLAGHDLNNDNNLWLEISDVEVICNGLEQMVSDIKMHPKADIAKIVLDDQILGLKPLAINTNYDYQSLSHKQCEVTGFGLDNENKIGRFHSSKVDSLELYNFKEVSILGALDYDFKAMGYTLANSMDYYAKMDKDFFPHLYNQLDASGITQSELNHSLKEFIDMIEDNELRFNDIFNQEKGPLYKEYFYSHFKQLYEKAFAALFAEVELERLRNAVPLDLFIVNVNNSTLEKSGIDAGDSGGAFACYFENKWNLVGINSKRSDSNLGYSGEPWDPMYSQPESRITKNGEIIPITEALMKVLAVD